MAIIVRNVGSDPNALANTVAQNLVAQSTTAVGTTFFHADSTSNALTPDVGFLIPQPPQGLYITQSQAVDLVSGIQLAMAIAGALVGQGATADPPAHFYDAPANSQVQCGAHKVQDAVNTTVAGSRAIFLASAQDQTAANTFANALKSAFNAHLTQSGVHYTNDTTNTEGAANASSLSTFMTLLNALRNHINAHVAQANPNFPQVRVIAP
jgi:hypothetical protein